MCCATIVTFWVERLRCGGAPSVTRLLRWSSKLGARFAVGIGTIMAIRRNEKGNGEPGVRFSPSGPYFYTGCGRRRFPKTDAVFKIRTRAHREQECLRMSFGRKGKHIEERLFIIVALKIVSLETCALFLHHLQL